MKERHEKWTPETIREAALKAGSRGDFRRFYGGAVNAAKKMGILEEILSLLPAKLRAPWTKEEVLKEAKKYESRSSFRINSSGAYDAAKRLNVFDEACSHMTRPQLHEKKWAKDSIFEEALKYQSRWEFSKLSSGAYYAASKKGILDKVCAHMEVKRAAWDFAQIQAEASRFSTLNEFRINSPKAYRAARRQNLLNKVCNHMKERCEITPEMVLEEASKYQLMTNFKKEASWAYSASRTLGILNEVKATIAENKKQKSQ
jgi:hypothetical protein